MKTELVSIVSHELRTPLASVLGFTSLLLKRDFEPDHAPSLPRHRRRAGAQAGRAAGGLSRRPANRARGRRPRDGDASTWRCSSMSRPSSMPRRVPKHRLEVALEERPLTVRGDPERLAQVVGNLLSNAIKYSPDGGTVDARGRAQRRRRPRRSCATRGSGIPADQQEPDLHEVLPRRRGRDRDHRHGPRPRGLARDRGGARRPDRLRQRPRHGLDLLARAAERPGGRDHDEQRRRRDEAENRLAAGGRDPACLPSGRWQSRSEAGTGPGNDPRSRTARCR